jgi:hypothetical protein
MPGEQRVGRHNRRDLPQRLTAEAVRSHGQAAAIVIREPQTPPTELPAQEAVLFDQVGEHVPFAALEPTSQDQQQRLQGLGGDHAREVISQPAGTVRHNSSIEWWDITGSRRYA